MPHVYILRCSDGTFYTGSTNNLERRLHEHRIGEGARYTAVRRPVELVFAEFRDKPHEAFALEKQIQGWSHEKKAALIDANLRQLKGLARCPNPTHARLIPLSPSG